MSWIKRYVNAVVSYLPASQQQDVRDELTDLLQQRMQEWMQGFTDDISAVLKKDYPSASEQQLAAVSYGLISLYFNLDSLAPLGMNHIYRQPAQVAAGYLLDVLKN